MNLRKATPDDLEIVVGYAREFHSASPYRDIPFDESSAVATILGLMQIGVVFVNDGGFIAGGINPLVFNPSAKIASEMAWYCPTGDGQELKDAFEAWAKDNGAGATQFSVLNDDSSTKLSQMLSDDGYRPIEIAFIKGIA